MYITNSNLKRLLSSIASANTQGIELHINNPIINDILSEVELKNLKDYKAFFLGRSINIDQLRPVKVVDNLRFVKPPTNPAYHSSSSCERAHSDFEAHLVPEVIRVKGKEAVEDYRRRVAGLDLFNMDHCITLAAELGIELRHITETVQEDNSGVDTFKIRKISDLESMTIQEIDQELTKISDIIRNFIQTSEIHQYIYGLRFLEPNELRWVLDNDPNNHSNISVIGNEFSYLKNYIKQALETKLKKESNFDQSQIEEKLLKKLNFVRCQAC